MHTKIIGTTGLAGTSFILLGLAMPQPAIAESQPNYVCRGFTGPQADYDGTPMMMAKDGAVWLIRQNENRLIRIDKNHHVTAVIPVDGANGPLEGMTIAADGSIWYSKISGHRMGRIPANGGKGIEYELPYENASPAALAADSKGRIWYTDAVNNKVGYMTNDGKVVTFDAPTPDHSIAAPGSIAIAADNSVWVISMLLNAVLRVDPESGTFTRYDIPTPGGNPTLLTRGPQGALWFLMPAMNKIGRITSSGEITEFETGSALTESIGAGPDEAIWFSSMYEVGRLDPSSGRVKKFACVGGGGMTVGPDGHLWVQSKAGDNIYEVKDRRQGIAARVVGTTAARTTVQRKP
jgi:virginiamycin B lyase